MTSSQKSRNWALDCLRLIAVLLVIARHLQGDVVGPGRILWDLLRRGGWVGVDLFFVLSGYLVGGLLFREHQMRGTLDWKRFLIRRGLKIYPAFYVWLAVVLALPLFRGFWPNLPQVLGEVFFLQNYVGALRYHTWTLAVEEHFYLALIAALVFLCRRSQPGRHPFAVVPKLVTGIAVLCLVLRLITDQRGTALGSSKFSPGDLSDTSSLAAKIAQPADDFSAYLRGRFQEKTVQGMTAWRGSRIVPSAEQRPVIEDLNAIVLGPSIWDDRRFVMVKLRPETRELVRDAVTVRQLARLNRQLLEDAYPTELSKNPNLSTVYWTHLRLDALAFGVLLAYWQIFQPKSMSRWVGSCRWSLILGGLVLLAPVFFLPIETNWWIRTFGFTMNYLGAGAVLLACVDLGSVQQPSKVVAGMAWLGAWSYSIYLWHVDVIVQLSHKLQTERGWSAWSTAGISLIASLLVGVTFGRLVEWPVVWWRNRRFPSRADEGSVLLVSKD